jgi:WD40 repeat protein
LRASTTAIGDLRIVGTLDGNRIDRTIPTATRKGIGSARFSHGGHYVAVTEIDSEVSILDVKTGKTIRLIYGEDWDHATAACFSPDDRHVCVGWDDGGISMHGLKRYESLWIAGVSGERISTSCYSRAGNALALGTESGYVYVCDMCNRKPMWSFTDDGEIVTALCFSPDGSKIASGSIYGGVTLWDIGERADSKQCMYAKYGTATSISISPRGSIVAVGSADGIVSLWDANSGAEHYNNSLSLSGIGSIASMAFSSSGELLMIVQEDGSVTVWDMRRYLVLETGCEYKMHTIASPVDECPFVTVSRDGRVHFWDKDLSARTEAIECGHDGLANVSPSGKMVAVSDSEGTIRLWDAMRHEVSAVLAGNRKSRLVMMDFMDEHKIVTVHSSGEVCVWDIDKVCPAETFNPLLGIDLTGIDLSYAKFEDEQTRESLGRSGAIVYQSQGEL